MARTSVDAIGSSGSLLNNVRDSEDTRAHSTFARDLFILLQMARERTSNGFLLFTGNSHKRLAEDIAR